MLCGGSPKTRTLDARRAGQKLKSTARSPVWFMQPDKYVGVDRMSPTGMDKAL